MKGEGREGAQMDLNEHRIKGVKANKRIFPCIKKSVKALSRPLGHQGLTEVIKQQGSKRVGVGGLEQS